MTSAARERRPLILLGAGGHAKVVLSLVLAAGWKVIGVCDPELGSGNVERWRGLDVLGGDDALDAVDPAGMVLANGVGQLGAGPCPRRRVFESLVERGFVFPPLVHPAAWIDPGTILSAGVQIMAGVVVQADCRIGENSIVNTRASVDHDSILGAHVHIAPGVMLCGSVTIDEGAFIGAGATVVQGIRIGAAAFVSAASLVSRDVPAGSRGGVRARGRVGSARTERDR